MKIFTKILVTLVVMTSMLFSSLYVLLQWSFDEGMLNYINQREIRGLELLARNLVKVNEEIGDLVLLKDNQSWWHEIVKASALGKSLDNNPISKIKAESVLRGDRGKMHPSMRDGFKPPRDHKRRPPPPHHSDNMDDSHPFNYAENERPPRREGPKGPHKPPPNMLENNKAQAKDISFPRSRVPSLLNSNKEVIIGGFNKQFSFLPITNDVGIIGYLALPPAKEITSSFDLAFSENQRNTWLFILIAVFTVTFIVAVILSRYLVKNIQTIALATHQLNQGDYKIKLLPHGQDELAMLARDFNDLAKTLSQNDHSRKAWLADISHELRTPLAIVKGEIEALQDGIRQVTPDSLQSLADEINHLQKLINDLNQLSNADIGTMNYQKNTVNIGELLAQNVQRRINGIEDKGITLTTKFNEHNLKIWADETRLNQLFDNVITNSLKYTDSPGEIAIALNKHNNNTIITIEDSSPSVPAGDIDKLFNHLFRVESSRNRKTGGSGLGLALCKKIVEAHHGEISAYPSKLGGLGISISLPIL